MEVRVSSHGLYRLQYHVVWVTKYRRRILKPFVVEYLRKVLPKLLRSMPGVTIEQMGFDNDHMHLVMVIPPKYSIAEVMGELKARSASNMRKTFNWLSKVYWKENVVWSTGYFVSSVGLDEHTIRNYVEHQGRKDSGQLRMEL
ncbi:IS200/IS605 family transposase [Aestuariibacter salexigens]|uniref:IS200/IS605 family transposase n=1 Tax=Aestuariibacter salexigens TaxID=226010 RepID=UPI00047C2D30|nr:IS200/IS605 family transposase [Aestuariibacter salexigens]